MLCIVIFIYFDFCFTTSSVDLTFHGKVYASVNRYVPYPVCITHVIRYGFLVILVCLVIHIHGYTLSRVMYVYVLRTHTFPILGVTRIPDSKHPKKV